MPPRTPCPTCGNRWARDHHPHGTTCSECRHPIPKDPTPDDPHEPPWWWYMGHDEDPATQRPDPRDQPPPTPCEGCADFCRSCYDLRPPNAEGPH